jgi:hypothetical protein
MGDGEPKAEAYDKHQFAECVLVAVSGIDMRRPPSLLPNSVVASRSSLSYAAVRFMQIATPSNVVTSLPPLPPPPRRGRAKCAWLEGGGVWSEEVEVGKSASRCGVFTCSSMSAVLSVPRRHKV